MPENLLIRCTLIGLLASLTAGELYGQGTLADYRRANSLRRLTQNKVFRDRIEPNWSEDGSNFWYRVNLADGKREFVFVDAEQGLREAAFDHERLAAALTEETGEAHDSERLPVEQLEFDSAEGVMTLRAAEKTWRCDLETYEIEELTAADLPPPEGLAELPPSAAPRSSRDTGRETYVRFLNRSGVNVDLFWLDRDGRRQKYATLEDDEEHEQHTFAGHVWLIEDSDGTPLSVFVAEARPGTAAITGMPPAVERPRDSGQQTGRGRRRGPGNRSPDGRWEVAFRDFNVILRLVESDEEFVLSEDGQTDDGYTGGVFWSPDSQRFVAMRTRPGDERTVYLIESSPEEQVQPRLHQMNYLKPGDQVTANSPRLFDVESRAEIPVDAALFENPWSIRNVRWEPDSSRFTFLYNQRGHQILRLISVDAVSGNVSAVVDEQTDTFIDYTNKVFVDFLEESDELIWMSERDGWNHLYLYDARTGEVKNQITRGEWLVRGVERVDEERRQIWFRAGGIVPGQDPYYIHYARVDFDGTGLTLLTEGDGTHSLDYSPDGRYFVDTYSRVDMPPVNELRSSDDGSLVCGLEESDWSDLVETGWQTPERFVAKGRDGETDIHGIILRPTDFDPERSYPVIEYIYAGPHGSFVPRNFRAFQGQQALAELGFVVVQMDGMGTNHRSKAFHDVCWQNLGDSGFPDRILWMQAAAEEYPYLDLDRVGIYGNSAGGQSSLRAMLAHGDFYKAAVSSCGCHDNRMDKIWWNEQWMGWPIGPHYEDQSNVTNAHRLQGDLLLIVGEMDRNVDPTSTLQVVDALIKANKDFDLLFIPGGGHGMGGAYGERRMRDFFVRHLHGVEPPNRNAEN